MNILQRVQLVGCVQVKDIEEDFYIFSVKLDIVIVQNSYNLVTNIIRRPTNIHLATIKD